MATFVRRVASRLVNCSRNRSSVYSFPNQSWAVNGRLRHLTPSISRNIPFTTSTRKRVSSTDPLLRVIETEIGFAEQADDYDRVNPNFLLRTHLHVFLKLCFYCQFVLIRSRERQKWYIISLFLLLFKGWRNSKWFPFQNGRQTRS